MSATDAAPARMSATDAAARETAAAAPFAVGPTGAPRTDAEAGIEAATGVAEVLALVARRLTVPA